MVIVSVSLGGAVWGLRAMERQLLSAERTGLVPSGRQDTRAAVEFHYAMGYPAWMPRRAANEIVASLDAPEADLDDPGLTDQVRRRAQANPWVQRVYEVTKELTDDGGVGIVTVRCEFRRPVAKLVLRCDLAGIDENTVYLDAHGVRLPASQAPKYEAWTRTSADAAPRWRPYVWREDVPAGAAVRAIHYASIRGAAGDPPPEGQRWTDSDVTAGLRLVALVADRPYADQITMLDVRNYDGRISPNEPHLRMWAQAGRERPTDIRFGRFPRPGGDDYVVSPERKLSYLDEYVRLNGGRLAGLHRYLDLRYDQGYASLH